MTDLNTRVGNIQGTVNGIAKQLDDFINRVDRDSADKEERLRTVEGKFKWVYGVAAGLALVFSKVDFTQFISLASAAANHLR